MASQASASSFSDAGANRCLRMTSETLSSLLFLSSVALTSFGAFMLYEWRRGDATQTHAVPGYVYLILVLGGAASASNALSYIGACSRSVCLISTSMMLVVGVLLLEVALALVLCYDPSLVDNVVCPPEDTACLERIDNLFKDPTAHAGVAVSVVCGVQTLALIILLLLRTSTRRLYTNDQNVDTLLWDRGGMQRTLLEEHDWQIARDDFEERSRQRIAERQNKYRSLLSNVARDALSRKPQATPAAAW
eukprot:CAMPEP_0173082244 /NCGR_PEP_ID=MMETSP1102-20130122/18080_1 /TAXON_ID=49646 /ORGANISM="Geminigera sp., Strain Caron Lab Isolate" /LENGTH=248 /DNA_ID=CAMNT_0013957633 /DNA_START=8 /DNA_END=751 /DNA_ORIENTATION=-